MPTDRKEEQIRYRRDQESRRAAELLARENPPPEPPEITADEVEQDAPAEEIEQDG